MKSKLLVLITAIILIMTVILLFELQNTTEDEIIYRFSAQQSTAANQIAREIENYLSGRTQGTEVLSSFASLQYRDIKQMEADIQKFFDYVKKYLVKAISVYDEKGTILYSAAESVIGRNYDQLDFFQWAAKKENKGKQFVSSLTYKKNRESNRTTAIFSLPHRFPYLSRNQEYAVPETFA